MSLKSAEQNFSAWSGRLLLAAAVIGSLYAGFAYFRSQDEDMAAGAAHRADSHSETVKDLVQDLAEQREVDEEFRQKALGKIGEGFEKHDERISGLEDASKETRFLIREQRTLQQIETQRLAEDRARIKQVEEQQRAAELRRAAELDAIRNRPVEVVVPEPSAP